MVGDLVASVCLLFDILDFSLILVSVKIYLVVIVVFLAAIQRLGLVAGQIHIEEHIADLDGVALLLSLGTLLLISWLRVLLIRFFQRCRFLCLLFGSFFRFVVVCCIIRFFFRFLRRLTFRGRLAAARLFLLLRFFVLLRIIVLLFHVFLELLLDNT